MDNIKDHRLWNVAWEKLSLDEKIEALRETIFEVVSDFRELQKINNFDEVAQEFKHEVELLESRINIKINSLKVEIKNE